jgi:Tol biopolymer transport system component
VPFFRVARAVVADLCFDLKKNLQNNRSPVEKSIMKLLCYTLSAFLTFGLLSVSAFAKAPETAKIIFASNRDGNFEIYIMNPDGSDQKNLTQHRANDFAPVWSPTGEQILFHSDRDGIAELYLMDADGTNVRQVFRKLIGRVFPTWSPDGKAFAYNRSNKLSTYIAPIDGKDEAKLAEGLWPAWSPNGSEIAFMGGQLAVIEGRIGGTNPKIEIINLQTHVEEVLLPGKIWMHDPAWAPDSSQIAFSWNGMEEKGFLGGNEKAPTIGIYVVNRDGSGLRKIIDAGDDAFVSNPTWSPHGNELIYYKRSGGVIQLFKIALDGGVPEQLTHRGNNFRADWFDPAALPVSPQSSLLTTIWAKLKTQD